MKAKDFKAGDKIVGLHPQNPRILTITKDFFAGQLFLCDDFYYINKEEMRHATAEEIEAGHRIDDVVPFYANPQFTYTVLTGAQVGSVLQLTPQIDDMGDDEELDQHISPFCEVHNL